MAPRRTQLLSGTLALGATLLAGCNVEVNIHLDGSEHSAEAEPLSSTTPLPSAPAPAPAAPEAGEWMGSKPAPIPRPEPWRISSETEAVVRDALWRPYELEDRTALPRPPEPPARDLSTEPTFTPFTVAPRISNAEEVRRATQRFYPPLLRDAGVGGMSRVYFFIDETGRVRDVRLDRSAGHRALDEAALSVAWTYRFTAAKNRGEPVPVWVSFPIRFGATR